MLPRLHSISICPIDYTPPLSPHIEVHSVLTVHANLCHDRNVTIYGSSSFLFFFPWRVIGQADRGTQLPVRYSSLSVVNMLFHQI